MKNKIKYSTKKIKLQIKTEIIIKINKTNNNI